MPHSDVYIDSTTHFQRESNPQLRQCAELGDWHGVLAALERDADPLSLSATGKNALMLAAEAGHLACVETLLEANPMAALHETPTGETALMLAADAGHAACVRVLVVESHVDAENSDGMCALMLSLGNNDVPTSRLLLLETDLHRNNRSSKRLLLRTIDLCAPACTQFLLEEGATPTHALGNATTDDSVGRTVGIRDVQIKEDLVSEARLLRIEASQIQEALTLAVSREQWACADALAPYADPLALAPLFKRVGARLLPRWGAWLEQQALGEALNMPTLSKAQARLASQRRDTREAAGLVLFASLFPDSAQTPPSETLAAGRLSAVSLTAPRIDTSSPSASTPKAPTPKPTAGSIEQAPRPRSLRRL